MSREPSSASMRHARSRGGYDPGPKAAPEPPAVSSPMKPRKPRYRVVVPPAKPKPAPPPRPTQGYYTTARQEQAMTKLTTTTEALTDEERQIVRGYRLSRGGPAADEVRRQIEKEVREQ